jgi:hypothetical protein
MGLQRGEYFWCCLWYSQKKSENECCTETDNIEKPGVDIYLAFR